FAAGNWGEIVAVRILRYVVRSKQWIGIRRRAAFDAEGASVEGAIGHRVGVERRAQHEDAHGGLVAHHADDAARDGAHQRRVGVVVGDVQGERRVVKGDVVAGCRYLQAGRDQRGGDVDV